MASRFNLQTELEEVLGSRNVYFQPPASIRMNYPAIQYSLSVIDSRYADDCLYNQLTGYEIILIDEDPDSIFVHQLLELRFCSFDRQYKADNLNHFVFTIYY